jgi:hypothetical protein
MRPLSCLADAPAGSTALPSVPSPPRGGAARATRVRGRGWGQLPDRQCWAWAAGALALIDAAGKARWGGPAEQSGAPPVLGGRRRRIERRSARALPEMGPVRPYQRPCAVASRAVGTVLPRTDEPAGSGSRPRIEIPRALGLCRLRPARGARAGLAGLVPRCAAGPRLAGRAFPRAAHPHRGTRPGPARGRRPPWPPPGRSTALGPFDLGAGARPGDRFDGPSGWTAAAQESSLGSGGRRGTREHDRWGWAATALTPAGWRRPSAPGSPSCS